MITNYKNFTKETHSEWFEKDAVFSYDTESCGTVIEGETHAYVYLTGLGCSTSDKMIWGNTCLDVLEVFKIIARETGRTAFEILVHNLKWDYGFMAYELEEIGNKEVTSVIRDQKTTEKGKIKLDCNQRHLIAKKDDIYQATITLDETVKGEERPRLANGKRPRVKKDTPITLTFSCTAKRFPRKLEQIAKSVLKLDERFWKVQDYDYDTTRERYTHVPTQFELDYLYNDVYIVKEFYNQFMKPYNYTSLTASAHAFRFFIENKYGNGSHGKNKDEFYEHYPKDQKFDFAYASYRGGWTSGHVATRGLEIPLPKTGTSIDINSSYPSVVKKKPLPYGYGVRRTGHHQANENEMNLLTITFDGWYMKDDRNPFGVFQRGTNMDSEGRSSDYMPTNIFNGVIDFSVGQTTLIGNDPYKQGYLPNAKHSCVWHVWEFELNDILENMHLVVCKEEDDEPFPTGEDWEEGYHVEYTTTYPCEIGYFADAVDECMKMKNDGKKQGNIPMSEQGKLMANSFYGKMGSKTYREVCHDILNKNGIMTRSVKEEDADGNEIEFAYHSEDTFFIPFASCVTAWARTNLRQRLYEIGFENILYFDTDSLYTTITEEELLQTNVPIDEYELGDWKVEKRYTRFKWIASKKYILEDIKEGICVKCLGLPKDAQENISFETFHIGAEVDGGKKKKKVKGGALLIATQYTIKEFD